MKKHLFVCGCPRSGTTVITQLLNWHPQVSIGMERYGQLLQRRPDRFSPKLFNSNRFFNIKERDCFYDSFEFKAYSDWYCSKFSQEKYKDSIYVGDKIPEMYKFFAVIEKNFAETEYKIIFILRDLPSVAASYNARANNPQDRWNADKDAKQAVIDWNAAIVAVYEQLQKNKTNSVLIPVKYNDFFTDYDRGKNKLTDLFEKIELTTTKEVLEGYKLLGDRFEKIQKRREKVGQGAGEIYELDPEYLQKHAEFDKYNFIEKQCI
jgi:hypothetical protein